MPDIEAKRSHVRIAAAILAALLLAATVFTYLSYTAKVSEDATDAGTYLITSGLSEDATDPGTYLIGD